jgi:ABC-type glycerol-3-phosphate transport system substrate-binding protein
MVAAGMGNSRRLAVAVAAVLALAGCGGERQDANAPSGEFGLEVTDASFPAEQRIAEPSTLKLEVENTGDRSVPNVAVVVETEAEKGKAPAAFAQDVGNATLADSGRPVWILDEGPAGGESAYTNTWAVGPLGEGQSRTVEWKLTAIKPGRYTVAWRLAPSLEGDVELAEGRTEGEFAVTISDRPVPARVNDDGEVVRGEEAGR